MRTNGPRMSPVWVPGTQKATPSGRTPTSQDAPMTGKEWLPHLPRKPSSSRLLPSPLSPHRSESVCPSDGHSNRAPIIRFLTPLPRAHTLLSLPRHGSSSATLTGRPWTSLRHSLVQDEVEIKGSSAGGLLLGAHQPPRTAEHQQPQPGDQPAPGTAGQGQPRHHPAARGLRLPSRSQPPRLDSVGTLRVAVTRDTPRGEGQWAARAPAPGAAGPTNWQWEREREGGRKRGREVLGGQRETLQPPQLPPELLTNPSGSAIQSSPSGFRRVPADNEGPRRQLEREVPLGLWPRL